MSLLVIRIVKTSCPNCGQESRKVIRRSQLDIKERMPSRIAEECMDCALKRERPIAAAYLARLWRSLWLKAGGTVAEMPDCLRVPSDPLRPAPRPDPDPTNPPATPTWKNQALLLPQPRPEKRRPKVLFVSHDLKPQGSQRILLNILPQLRGMEVSLHALASGPLRPLFLERGIRIVEEFHQEDFDLIAVNTTASHRVVEGAKQSQTPLVWFIHEWACEPWLSPELFKEKAKWARRIVFAHAAQRQQFSLIPDSQATTIPTVIPPLIPPTRGDSRRLLGIASDTFLAVTFGMNEPRKGQSDLRRAVSDLSITVECVAGETDTRPWLGAADVYVSTSRQECYPLAIQEAKAARLPTIASKIPVHAEMLEHGVNGLLYDTGDVDTLRKQLLLLQRDAELRQRIAEAPIHAPSWEDYLLSTERLLLREAGTGTDGQEAVRVVYHICGMGDHWRGIVKEQLSLLQRHGLNRVHCTHCGEGLDWCCATAREMGLDLVVCSSDIAVTVYERPAIQLIERLAAASDTPILYLHSKGVSYQRAEGWYAEWRRLMQEELVPNWRQHVCNLADYDAIGVNWWTAPNKGHFSGNFWMAHPRWLRQLPAIKIYWRDRYSPERWIGSVPGCRAKSLLVQDAAFWDKDRVLLAELRKAQLARLSANQEVSCDL